MTDENLNAEVYASVQSIFQTIFTTNQMTQADLQTLLLFIRGTQDLLPDDLQNLNLIIELLQCGKLKILG
ncbi:MAG: hypothetical protein VKK42_14935 [Lyngbya sp.]|nr:hypothetical protein [Lyngbya sp.]